MIVSIGEIVWDIIADKKLLGGAPLNVAYHLSSYGLEVRLISRIGNDELADLTLGHIADLGLPVAGIQRDDELRQVADWSGIADGSIPQRARALCRRLQLLCLAVTRGPAGALLVTKDGLFEHQGYPVKVADTVGAGDAFFATLIEGIIHKRPWQECLARANKRGSYVAGRPGATPPMQDFVF